MKIIIFEFLVLIKYFLFIISILGILVQAHRKNLVQANSHASKTTNRHSKAETILKLKVHSQVLQNYFSSEKNYIL